MISEIGREDGEPEEIEVEGMSRQGHRQIAFCHGL
jgi:hypothetical protein